MGKTKLLMKAGANITDKDTWLANKANHISGTDAGVIMGANPWKSPLELYYEKLGTTPAPDISEKEPVYWGTILEEVVAREFEKRTGEKVRRRGMVQDTMCPYRIANVDRLLIGSPEGLECKTTSAYHADDWADGAIPTNYYYQCLHYLLVMFGDAAGHLLPEYWTAERKPAWWIACLIGGQKFVMNKIYWNEEEMVRLAAAEKDFWGHLQKKIPPDYSSNDSETAMLSKMNDGTARPVTFDKNAQASLHLYQLAKEREEEAHKATIYYKNALIGALGDAQEGYGLGYKVTYKTGKPRETVAMKDILSNVKVYNACAEAGIIKTVAGARVLRVKKIKGGK